MKDFNEFSQKLNEESVSDDSIKSVDDASGPDFKDPENQQEKEDNTEEKEESSEESNKESNSSIETIQKSLTTLFTSRDQAHYFHLQTESYAEHKALDMYYNEILDLTDSLIESAQGEYGRVKGKITIELDDYSSEAVTKHLDETLECIRDCRDVIANRALEAIYDDIENLIQKTKYLLTLK